MNGNRTAHQRRLLRAVTITQMEFTQNIQEPHFLGGLSQRAIYSFVTDRVTHFQVRLNQRYPKQRQYFGTSVLRAVASFFITSCYGSDMRLRWTRLYCRCCCTITTSNSIWRLDRVQCPARRLVAVQRRRGVLGHKTGVADPT